MIYSYRNYQEIPTDYVLLRSDALAAWGSIVDGSRKNVLKSIPLLGAGQNTWIQDLGNNERYWTERPNSTKMNEIDWYMTDLYDTHKIFTLLQNSKNMAYSPPTMFRSIQVTDSLKLADTDVLPTLLGLQTGLGNLGTTDITLKNVACTSINATGNITGNDVTATGNLTSYNSIYGGVNGFSIRPRNGAAGLLLFGDGSLRCDVNLTVIGSASCNTAPSAVSHLCRKDYVDALSYVTAGVGLTKTGSTLSVNAAQSAITSVGTLTGLTLSGAITGTSATFSSPITVGTPTAAGNATTKTYVDTALGLKSDKTYVDALSYVTAGVGLTKTASTLSVNAAQPGITSVGTLSSLAVTGALSASTGTFTGQLLLGNGKVFQTATSTSDYSMLGTNPIDGVQNTRIFIGGYTMGGFAGKIEYQATSTGNHVFYNAGVQTAAISSTGLSVTGTITATSFSGNLIGGTLSATTGSFSGALTAASGTNPVDGLQNTRIVVSGNTRPTYAGGIEYMATSTGNHVFSNAGVQTLTISSTGLALTGGLSATTGNFSGNVASAAPSAGSHLTNKTYVDNAITTANAQVSTGTFTTGTFSISGLTFVGLTKTVRWSKLGAAVIVSAEFTWTSTTGTLVEADGNTTITTPFNSPVVRSMLATIQKDSFVTTRMSYMDEASPALRTRVNASDMPGYTTGATLLVSWIFYT